MYCLQTLNFVGWDFSEFFQNIFSIFSGYIFSDFIACDLSLADPIPGWDSTFHISTIYNLFCLLTCSKVGFLNLFYINHSIIFFVNMANSRMKLKILSTEPPTEEHLLTMLTDISPVAFRDIHIVSFNAFAVLNNSEDYSKFKTPEATETLKQHNLRLVHDANAASMNVFVTRVGPFNINLITEELIGSINSANPFKVSNVFLAKRKSYVNGQLLSLKLTMETEDDISTILSEGVVINKLVYPPDLIHREEAIPYNKCCKCFEFGHETKYCTSPKACCSKCAETHNFRDCKSSYRKCKLCEGSHLAVSFQCPQNEKIYSETE